MHPRTGTILRQANNFQIPPLKTAPAATGRYLKYRERLQIADLLEQGLPDDQTLRLCPEPIYRALLLREGQGLNKRYAARLRTGRRIRKTRWRTRTGHGSRIRNMTMIDQRPAEVETRLEAGHWEGDLVRHEALFYRAKVEDLRRCAVVAA